MRPVLLEIDGFTSYRNKAVIDFRDIDFFALVGPTGSGKSTILDAITFALYGTAPRWGNVNAVAPALAPNSNRAVVRLIFDADGRRYSVVRDVRRGGGRTQAITVKEQRLERFHNPNDDGTGDTDVLESGDGVKTKVAELLGLSFQEFCTCVVLPQGDFSKFLHAKPSERQDILSKLLGHQIYDRIQSTANARSREQQTRANTLAEQLDQFDVLVPVAQHEARIRTLVELETELRSRLLPTHREAADSVARLGSEIAKVDSERSILADVSVPPEVEGLQRASTSTQTALNDARHVESAALQAEQSIRDALAAAQPRLRLEMIRDQWSELTALEVRLPDLVSALKGADAALESAIVGENDAEAKAGDARTTVEISKANADAASAAEANCRTNIDALQSIRPPQRLDELAESLRSASTALAAATTLHEQADAADQEARALLGSLPDSGSLSAASGLIQRIAEFDSADAAAAIAAQADESALARLREAASAAEDAVEQAERHLADVELQDRASALRESLHVGDACPVCEQTVHTVPHVATTSIAEARTALAAAKAELKRLEKELSEARSAANARVAARVEASRTADNDRKRLAELLGDMRIEAGAVEAVRAQRAEAAQRAESCSGSLRAAKAGLQKASDDVKALEDRRQAAQSSLRSARDAVLALGAPSLDEGDIAGGWESLLRWSQDRLAELNVEVTAVASSATDASRVLAEAEADLRAQLADAVAARQKRTDAALAQQRADFALKTAESRRAELQIALSGALDSRAVAVELDRVIALENDAAVARKRVLAAQDATHAAQTAADAAAAATTRSWRDLRKARDGLTTFGAPDVDGDDLHTGWTLLATWATGQAALRSEQLVTLRAENVRAAQSAEEAATAIRLKLLDAGIDATPDTATTRLASELARAQAALDRAKQDLARAEKLRAEIADATEKAQVAKELALLMRSNNFPQWLINSALTALIGEASTVLFELSNGQFELTSEEGNLYVIDHNNADLTRSVKTLSGGETFQASLALALALSRQMSALSTTGSAKLEAIFLDEGFGTLDGETLDEVASTLETLAASGSRMVGVVTHVPALADRIPVRLRVSRDDKGSHVEVERV